MNEWDRQYTNDIERHVHNCASPDSLAKVVVEALRGFHKGRAFLVAIAKEVSPKPPIRPAQKPLSIQVDPTEYLARTEQAIVMEDLHRRLDQDFGKTLRSDQVRAAVMSIVEWVVRRSSPTSPRIENAVRMWKCDQCNTHNNLKRDKCYKCSNRTGTIV